MINNFCSRRGGGLGRRLQRLSDARSDWAATAAAAAAATKVENLRRVGGSTDVRFELDLASPFKMDLTSRFEFDLTSRFELNGCPCRTRFDVCFELKLTSISNSI